MTTITRYRGRTSLAISLIAALLLALPLRSVRAASTFTVVSPSDASSRTGNTYGGWSATWWQYVLSQPKSSNPLNDSTGAMCGVGQSSSVFFLVGTAGGGTATRSCTVPANEYLFFPLVNAFDVHVSCTQDPDPTVCDTRNDADQVWNDLEHTGKFKIFTLQASIDNVPVSNLNPATTPYLACAGPADVSRCSAPAFSLHFPANNLFGLPAGSYAPAVADGAYLLLAPLTPGAHTIKFGGSGYSFGKTSEDITYNLTVST